MEEKKNSIVSRVFIRISHSKKLNISKRHRVLRIFKNHLKYKKIPFQRN